MDRLRITLFLALFVLISTFSGIRAQTAETYFPPRHQWEHREPGEVGLNAEMIQQAVQFAIDHETSNTRDLELLLNSRTGEPHNNLVGPVKTRGPMTGLIVKDGFIVAEWGDLQRVDMTFSVTKSYLSTTVGLAWDRGMIEQIDDKARNYVPTDHFNSEHNAKITWNHLLRQTSDWEGTLFGKPDWADRPREELTPDVINRERHEPGTVWKYNDVRVNMLALAALHVWRKPLPMVLKEYVMDPIGASNTWRWYGYENSWINIDGVRMQSVSGGGHWGGGMWINALDQARFGYLFLRNGNWNGDQIISKDWIKMARTPTDANNTYGFMNFFLNTGGEWLPDAPEKAFFFLGSGTNMVYIDRQHDLVVVARWIDRSAMNGLIKRILAAYE